MAQKPRTMTPIAIEDRERAKRLTAKLFKQHRPKWAKPGPGHAIQESLALMERCLAGEVVIVPKDKFSALKDAALDVKILSEMIELIALTASINALLVVDNLPEEDAERQADKLDKGRLDHHGREMLAFVHRQAAAAVLDAEVEADETEQARLIRLASRILNSADAMNPPTFETGDKTGARQAQQARH